MKAVAWVLVGAIGCRSTAIVDTEQVGPILPQPACLDYQRLPTEGMGELVLVQEASEFSLEPDGIETLVSFLGGDLGSIAYGVDTYRIRYTTQDRGKAVEATALVSVPRRVDETPLVVYHHGTTGMIDACAPSYPGNGNAYLVPVFAGALGMVVVAPDFLGMNGIGPGATFLHPWIAPEPTAIASLDSARAALKLAEVEGFEAQPRGDQLVLFGASQGGHASAWSERFQMGYAPELSTVAVVAGVPPLDVPGNTALSLVEWSRGSAATPSLLTGLAEYYELDVTDVLLPDVAQTVSDVVRSGCDILNPASPLDTLESVYTPEFLAFDSFGPNHPDWGCVFDHNVVSASPLAPTGAPWMLVMGEADDLAHPGPTRSEAEELCDMSIEVTLLECAGAGHEDAVIDTLPQQLDWIRARVAGEPVTDACVLPGPVTCP